MACEGRPFLAEVAGRARARGGDAGAGGLATVVDALVDAAGERARRLLALLPAADAWIAVGELAALTAATVGEIDDALDALERDGLVRRAGPMGPDGAVDVYHDAVRAAAAGVLASPEVTAAHAAFADRLAGDPSARPERLRSRMSSRWPRLKSESDDSIGIRRRPADTRWPGFARRTAIVDDREVRC